MAWCASRFIVFFALFSAIVWADDRVYFASENEAQEAWNSPPAGSTIQLENGKSNLDNDSPQPRFLPFSASFTLSSGGNANNAHSLSVGGSQDGISFSQSASQAGSSFGNEGSGLSASQSSSFSAGLSGISAADANSFNLNHPTFGGNSQANSNSWSLGQATSSSQGNVVNGQAASGAQSAVGSAHSSANSGAGSSSGQGQRQGRPNWTDFGIGNFYNPNGARPNSQRPANAHRGPQKGTAQNGHYHSSGNSFSGSQQNWGYNQGSSGNSDSWTQSPLTGPQPGSWSNSQGGNPGLQISGASASSSANSNSGGSSFGQSSSQSSFGPNGPTSWTNNKVQTSGNAQSQAQGAAAAVGQGFNGNTQASFSSGAIAGASQGNGHAQGNSASGNRGQNSWGQVTNHATGTASVQGTANSGSVSFVRFPGEENPQNLPREFVRSRPANESQRRRTSKNRDPVGGIIDHITDTVADIFDI